MYVKHFKNINRKIQINHTNLKCYIHLFSDIIYSIAVNTLMLRKRLLLRSPSESLVRNTLSELHIFPQIVAGARPVNLQVAGRRSLLYQVSIR